MRKGADSSVRAAHEGPAALGAVSEELSGQTWLPAVARREGKVALPWNQCPLFPHTHLLQIWCIWISLGLRWFNGSILMCVLGALQNGQGTWASRSSSRFLVSLQNICLRPVCFPVVLVVSPMQATGTICAWCQMLENGDGSLG